jgi:pimeloyl-ACP methyl ester carboxylesterase
VPGWVGGVATVPVQGGLLTYEVLAGATEPVLAIHGVSSQRRLWNWLHAEAPELTLIAPDLRGRADSVAISGPFSLAQHVDDMILILDQLEVEAIHICGASMGGFVAIRLAALHPTRVKSLILVDGGFPMDTPPGLTREMVPGHFADRLARLEDNWDDLDDYIAFFVSNNAPLLDREDPLLRDNLMHDLRDGRYGSRRMPWWPMQRTRSSTQIPGRACRFRFVSCMPNGALVPMVCRLTQMILLSAMSRTQSRCGHSADSIMLARS